MTQFKLTGFRLNKLQRIAEKATQKKVLYLQPEIKKGIRNEINFQDFVLREQGQAEGWDCSYHGQDYHQRYTVPQKHAESSISIPSLGLFDTNNPVYDPAEEEFRRRMQKKKKKRGPRL